MFQGKTSQSLLSILYIVLIEREVNAIKKLFIFLQQLQELTSFHIILLKFFHTFSHVLAVIAKPVFIT